MTGRLWLFFFFSFPVVFSSTLCMQLTYHWQTCTWAASLRWTSSTWDSPAVSRGSYRWTRWCRRSCRPAWRCSGHRNTPRACRWHIARACTPGCSCAPAHPVCTGLKRTVKGRRLIFTTGKELQTLSSICGCFLSEEMERLNQSSWSLTCDESLRFRLFFPPQRHKHGDVTNPPVPKPLHGQLDPPARKHLLVPVAVEQRIR